MTEPMIGDRYQIERRLSRKAGRETALAIDLATKKPVILKILRFSSDFGWNDLKLFEREIEILQSLSHPCIPRYLGHFELEPSQGMGLVLVQSYVSGRSLEEALKSGQTFSEAEIRQLAHALLEILIYLHGQNPPVIHRDIKPSNILLANRSGNSVGQVYLVDFGSVQTLAATEGGTMTIVGTYGYMPPEQFGGRTSPASDLYSLGATLVHLATGRHPADIPQTQLRFEFEPLTNLSSEMRRWLGRLVEPGLRERVRSAADALRGLLQPAETGIRGLALVSQRGEQSRVEKPENTKVMVLKQASWIDILVPQPDGDGRSDYTRLHIDSQEISLSSPIGQVLPPSLRLGIVGLECHSSDGSQGWLRVRTTRHTYALGGDGSLSPAELRWLAVELSDWLGLPVVYQ